MKTWQPEAGQISGSVPNTLYHADRTAVSSSWIKAFQKTPFHLRQMLDATPEPETALALAKGAAIDALVFERDTAAQQFAILGKDVNLRTKDGRAEKDKLLEKAAKKNLTFIRGEHWEECVLIADSVYANPMAKELMKKGKSQETFVWRDQGTRLLCKAKTDWYSPTHRAIIDLKTAVDGSPSGFSRAVANFGYHIQNAFYEDGVRACGRPVHEFIFMVVEKPAKDMKPDPRLVSFYRLSPSDIAEGRRSYESALAGISMCQLVDDWPGYTEDIIEIARPGWARQHDVEEQL